MDDWSIALVETSERLARVTKDLKHLGLSEARLQPLVH